MKKTIKTQNGKEPTDDSYKEQVSRIFSFNCHIAVLTVKRNKLIEQIKTAFSKSNENIEFELRKLRKD